MLQTQRLKSSYTVNEKVVEDNATFINNYLYGIPTFQKSGFGNFDQLLTQKIQAAQRRMENYLAVKFNPQIIIENFDYVAEDWHSRFLKTTYPVTKALLLRGSIGDFSVFTIPKEWLIEKTSTDPYSKFRHISIVPSTRGILNDDKNQLLLYSGAFPLTKIGFGRVIPKYWELTYCTGFDEVPEDIKDAILKVVAIEVLAQLGDITLGAGIAGLELSFDGFSQNIDTTQSAENSLYSARIRQFERELKGELKALLGRYKGISLTVC